MSFNSSAHHILRVFSFIYLNLRKWKKATDINLSARGTLLFTTWNHIWVHVWVVVWFHFCFSCCWFSYHRYYSFLSVIIIISSSLRLYTWWMDKEWLSRNLTTSRTRSWIVSTKFWMLIFLIQPALRILSTWWTDFFSS